MIHLQTTPRPIHIPSQQMLRSSGREAGRISKQDSCWETPCLSQENPSHTVQAWNSARWGTGSSYPSSPFQLRSVLALGCKAHDGMKGKGILGLHKLYEHESDNKDQAGKQKWLEQEVIVGFWGPLEKTCMSLQMRKSTWSGGCGTRELICPSASNWGHRDSIWADPASELTCWQTVLTCAHTYSHPQSSLLLKQNCLMALFACLIPGIHTQSTSMPAGGTFQPQHWSGLRHEAAAALLL